MSGFRARVKYQSGTTTQYQQVLIGNSSFRIGNTKFMLSGSGKAVAAGSSRLRSIALDKVRIASHRISHHVTASLLT